MRRLPAWGFAALALTAPSSGDGWLPLVGTDPRPGSAPDLVALEGWLGDADIVGLGESLHGVDEFRRLAHRIFAHLVERRGFSVFALEVSQAHAALLDDYVQGRRDDLDALLAGRWWASRVFYDRALRDLLAWMRDHNRTAARPVHFAGFDFKQPSFAMDAVLEALGQLDRGSAREAEQHYGSIRGLHGVGVYPNVYGYTATLTVPLPRDDGATALRARVKARGRSVSHGWVGLMLDGGGPAGSAETLYLAGDEMGEEWRDLELAAEVVEGVAEARLTVFHRGNGTVWFDALELTLDGRPLDPGAGLAGLEERPLDMPAIQPMDHRAELDDEVTVAGGRSLRVDCDPAVDRALAAAQRVDGLLDAALASATRRMPAQREAWLRQMSRLVVQATEYRTLVENDRDVFLAENVAWLEARGFPDSRVLALAHSSHTNRRARGKGMGRLLAERYGERYRTVTMLALAGRHAGFADPRSEVPGAMPEVLELGDPGGLERRLAALGAGDLLVALQDSAGSPTAIARPWLTEVPAGRVADVAILLREVSPISWP